MKKNLLVSYVLLGVITLGLFGSGLGLGYSRMVDPIVAFGLFAGGMALGVVTSVAGVIDLMKNGVTNRSAILVMGAIPACTLVYLVFESRDYPLINDVSTDLVYPPKFVDAKDAEGNAEADFEFPQEFKPQIEEHYADLVPEPVISSLDDAYFQALDIVNGLSGWEVTGNRIASRESFVEGTVTSTVFGFVDDFVIRISAAGSGGCVVDMRSRSREGQGDMGQNADHVRMFMGLLK